MKVSIIGYGTVGRALENLLKDHYQVEIGTPNADVIFVSLPTPEGKDGKCDISLIEKAINDIEAELIVIKSTVEPGTTDRLIKKTGKNIVFSPEYVGESKYFNPYFSHKMVETPFVIAGGKPELCNKLFDLLTPILGPTKQYYKTTALNAEIVKYMENCFFATKVAFVNEFKEICEHLGADWHDVRHGWLLDPRINPMHTSVINKGFGGKCYPKDLRAIIKLVDKLDIPVLRSVKKWINE